MTLLRRIAAPPTTPTPEELESWPVREDRPAQPMPDTSVSREAAALDKILPGWHNRINKRRLNLESNANCVLGQLYGDFADGIGVYIRSRHSGSRHSGGINTNGFFPMDDHKKAWKKEIDFRRKNW